MLTHGVMSCAWRRTRLFGPGSLATAAAQWRGAICHATPSLLQRSYAADSISSHEQGEGASAADLLPLAVAIVCETPPLSMSDHNERSISAMLRQIFTCLVASPGCKVPLKDVLNGVAHGLPLPLVKRYYNRQKSAAGKLATHPGSKLLQMLRYQGDAAGFGGSKHNLLEVTGPGWDVAGVAFRTGAEVEGDLVLSVPAVVASAQSRIRGYSGHWASSSLRVFEKAHNLPDLCKQLQSSGNPRLRALLDAVKLRWDPRMQPRAAVFRDVAACLALEPEGTTGMHHSLALSFIATLPSVTKALQLDNVSRYDEDIKTMQLMALLSNDRAFSLKDQRYVELNVSIVREDHAKVLSAQRSALQKQVDAEALAYKRASEASAQSSQLAQRVLEAATPASLSLADTIQLANTLQRVSQDRFSHLEQEALLSRLHDSVVKLHAAVAELCGVVVPVADKVEQQQEDEAALDSAGLCSLEDTPPPDHPPQTIAAAPESTEPLQPDSSLAPDAAGVHASASNLAATAPATATAAESFISTVWSDANLTQPSAVHPRTTQSFRAPPELKPLQAPSARFAETSSPFTAGVAAAPNPWSVPNNAFTMQSNAEMSRVKKSPRWSAGRPLGGSTDSGVGVHDAAASEDIAKLKELLGDRVLSPLLPSVPTAAPAKPTAAAVPRRQPISPVISNLTPAHPAVGRAAQQAAVPVASKQQGAAPLLPPASPAPPVYVINNAGSSQLQTMCLHVSQCKHLGMVAEKRGKGGMLLGVLAPATDAIIFLSEGNTNQDAVAQFNFSNLDAEDIEEEDDYRLREPSTFPTRIYLMDCNAGDCGWQAAVVEALQAAKGDKALTILTPDSSPDIPELLLKHSGANSGGIAVRQVRPPQPQAPKKTKKNKAKAKGSAAAGSTGAPTATPAYPHLAELPNGPELLRVAHALLALGVEEEESTSGLRDEMGASLASRD